MGLKLSGLTAHERSHPGIHYYGNDRGWYFFAGEILREPLTTQAWRDDLQQLSKPSLRVYFTSKLEVAKCYADRNDAKDREQALRLLADFENSKEPLMSIL